MWRDDLRLLGALVAIILRRWTCRCRQGWFVTDVDWIGVECARCGSVSPGIVVATAPIRLAWQHDRQRAQFRRRAS